jgi:hypothetical protein
MWNNSPSERAQVPHRRSRSIPRWVVVTSVFAFAVLGAGLAVADIPDGNTIHACRNKTTFALRVIDTDKAQTCTSSETALSWNSLRWRGSWLSTAAYVIGDAVSSGGQSYIAVSPSTNKAPATNPTAWNLMAAKGAPGVVSGLGTGTNLATEGTSGSTCVLGAIHLYAGNVFSADESKANGQVLSIASNTTLFALLGTTYGGDGKTTFALPNLQKLAPNHMTYTICVIGTFP